MMGYPPRQRPASAEDRSHEVSAEGHDAHLSGKEIEEGQYLLGLDDQ
jgi:hypothetical protein